MAKAPTGAPTGTAVAKAGSTALAMPAATMDFLNEQSAKSQPKITLNDVIMPRLSILQALSPAVNRRKPEYIEGAEPGLIVNVATLQLSEAVTVVPAHYIRHHIEWKPNRGGYVADHGEDEAIMNRVHHRDDKNFDILDNGNIIMPTPTWYCIDIQTGAQVVIPMPRTQARTSRSWMSQATSERLHHPTNGPFQAPLFFRAWTLTTAEKDDGENSWFVWSAARGPSVVETDAKGDLILPAGTMESAIRFRDLLTSGAIKADASHFEDGNEGRGGGRGRAEDDDAPM